MTPTALEIIKQYLIDNDYDGLVNKQIGCGCELCNLQPCGFDFSQCKPGYKYADPDKQFNFISDELKEGMERIE